MSSLNADTVTTMTAIGALLLSFVAVVFNAIQVAHLRRELREQTEQSIYDIALEWDRLLIDRPDLSDLLADPSNGPLTTQERVLAEYRLDLAELTHRKMTNRLYEAERDFFDRLISIPLLRKALASGAVDKSLKRDFLEQLKAALDAAAERARRGGARMVGTVAVTAKRVAGRFSRDSETAVLARGLADAGWTVRLFDWREVTPRGPLPATLAGADVLLHRYLGSLRERRLQQLGRYLVWTRERFAGAIVNDPGLLAFGRRKLYLFDYQRRGFPVVPSRYRPSWTGLGALAEAAAEAGWRTAVVKPIDGELCQDVHLLAEVSSRRYQAMAARTSGFVVQPFLEGIRRGQRSVLLVVVGGEPVPVYGMVKVPRGWHAKASLSSVREVVPSGEERELAVRLLRGWPGGRIVNGFARVDFVVDDARLHVLEVETVNPEGGLQCAGRAAQRHWVACFSRMLEEAARAAQRQVPPSPAGRPVATPTIG